MGEEGKGVTTLWLPNAASPAASGCVGRWVSRPAGMAAAAAAQLRVMAHMSHGSMNFSGLMNQTTDHYGRNGSVYRGINRSTALVQAGLCSSTSDARRQIKGGAVRVNDAQIGEACDASTGPWCAAGGTCVATDESGTAFICAKFCCSDSQCDAGQSCVVDGSYAPAASDMGVCR